MAITAKANDNISSDTTTNFRIKYIQLIVFLPLFLTNLRVTPIDANMAQFFQFYHFRANFFLLRSCHLGHAKMKNDHVCPISVLFPFNIAKKWQKLHNCYTKNPL